MFYISCNPGFEEELIQEVKDCWPLLVGVDGRPNQTALPEMKMERGGVAVEAPLELGIQLNFFLKTAHRVLWRVAEFRVRDFPKLFEKVARIPWERYLNSADIEWVVSASKSRLNNEKRIEETCQEAFQKAFKGPSVKSVPSQKIFVRMHDDLCSLSLDSSGDHLHKRGWGTRKGEAPLRETLAAFALRKMMAGIPAAELQKITLLDPMCGSGTMILEGISLRRPVFERDFSFFSWKMTPKLFKTELWRKNYKLLDTALPFRAYRGFDVDEKVLQAARDNLKDLQDQLHLVDSDVIFKNENLFVGDSQNTGPVWCISNPPYGERLHVQGQQAFSYEALLLQMATKFRAEKIGLLLPEKSLVKNMKPPKGYKKVLEVPFSNGGLDILFLVFTRHL